MREPESSGLPSWVQDVFTESPPENRNARDRIMARVRALPSPRTIAPPIRRSRWMRRGLLTPAGSTAATLFLLVVASLRIGADQLMRHSFEQSARVVGDTIVQRIAGGGLIHDTLLDTLRIVEFVVRGSGVRNAAITGDFNAWRTSQLQRVAATGEWRARLVVPQDALRFAFLINGERVAAPIIPATPSTATSDSI